MVSIKENSFLIIGKLTYEGRYWQGHKIDGLLMNSRMVQGIFDDMSTVPYSDFIYPDKKKGMPIETQMIL